MDISKNFDSKTLESKWYAFWMENNYFNSVPNNKPPYTIVIPPPNVTGILHMGHMLNNTIQDILIRRARLQGFNACWIPGTDHASIATEAKVVNKLKLEGINKSDLSRNEFLEHAWNWTDEHGGLILEQLKKLNANLQIVVAFRMLPKSVWKLPSYGTFNLHASLLPQDRSDAPINQPITNQEK